MLSLLEVAQKLAFSKYRSMIGHEAADSPSHCPEEERTSLQTSNQATTQPNIAENFSKCAHQPLIVPSTPEPESLVSISNSDTSTADEPLHASTDAREQAPLPRAEDRTLDCAQPKATMNSSSKSPFSSESGIGIDSSLSAPNEGIFCNNPRDQQRRVPRLYLLSRRIGIKSRQSRSEPFQLVSFLEHHSTDRPYIKCTIILRLNNACPFRATCIPLALVPSTCQKT
jgi:hypothetical protein